MPVPAHCLRLLLSTLRNPSDCVEYDMQDWDGLLRIARRANLISRLADGVDRAGVLDRLPVQVRSHLVASLMLARHQRQAVIWEARHLADALRSLNMPVVLLKGAAYSMAGLRAARGRLYGDIDILVPQARIDEVEAALMLKGWSTGGIDPYDDRYYRQWMHELPPMTHRRRGTVVDVHHNILPNTARHRPFPEQLLASAVSLPEGPFSTLSPADMVLHCATHLFHEGELHNGLRDLFDLDALLVEFAETIPAFWETLHDRAHLLGLAWPLRLAFRYLDHFLETPLPPDVMEALGRSEWLDGWRDFLYLPGFLPDLPVCHLGYQTTLAKGLLYLRGHYLRMPLHLLAMHLGRKAFIRLYKHTSRGN